MNLTDRFNLKSYWLRGGLIGLFFGIVLTIIGLTPGFDLVQDLYQSAALVLSRPLSDILMISSQTYTPGAYLEDLLWVSVLSMPLNLALFGFILGWIYGKTKSKK